MKRKSVVTFFALLLFGLYASAASAQTAGQAAAGSYRFTFDDGYLKTMDFDAVNRSEGSTDGSMLLTDEATLVIRDVDGADDPETGKYPGVTVKAQFDGLIVENKNQAVMSGTVTDATLRSLVGKRVLLTVEDNGDNTRESDKLTWGVYTVVQRDWTPSDSERKVDEGVGLRWEASDSERKDDTPIKMPREETTTTSSFPITSYDFAKVASASGDIRVTP
jgi:hypothetical protein